MNKISIQTFILFLLILSLSGCGTEISNIRESEAESEIVSSKFLHNESDVKEVEISSERNTIEYAGEPFEKSIFETGSEMIYTYGIKEEGAYFLGQMQIEGDIFQEFVVDIDKNMRAFNMVVDEQGNCHILWMSVEKIEINNQLFDAITNEKSMITIVNTSGMVVNEIDVTAIFSLGYGRPYSFIVDREGNYYFESVNQIIQVLEEGTLGSIVTCDGSVEGIGIGKSGALYATYRLENGETWLGAVEENTTCTSKVQMPEADAIYKGIYTGIDCELLFFNKSNGIYSYSENGIEERVPISQLPVSGEEMGGYGFLSDGRFCVLSQSDVDTMFYYVPSAVD
ncbi:MAG: hypothetical protein R3Y24_06055 [Eubacteriales bacterium]